MTVTRRILPFFTTVLIMLAAMLLICPSPASADGIDIIVDSDTVQGLITDFTITGDVDPDVDIDWDWGDTTIDISVTVEFGMSGNFDLQILKESLPAGTTAEDFVDRNTPGIYIEQIVPDIFSFLPKIGWGGTMGTDLIIGATHPADVKGHFDIGVKLEISSLSGFTIDSTSVFDYSSVKPKNKEEDTTVCIGLNSYGGLKLGYVEVLGWELGPIVNFDMEATDCGKAEATLHKDEWVRTEELDDDINILHTCTENGKEGCVSGELVNSVEFNATAGAHLVISTLFGDITVIDKDWTIAKTQIITSESPFVQSLTWEEPLKKQEYCDHLLYKVPVRVWADDQHTDPVPGIIVKGEPHPEPDTTAVRYESDETGKNPTLQKYPYYQGRANIYLPYKDGKYTVDADTTGTAYAEFTGKGEMPMPMVRGANAPVDIVLKDSETRQLSVEKSWDIDFEFKDRPESVDVLLQAQHYSTESMFTWEGVQQATLNADNNWSFTFDPVPKYEIVSGVKKEIKYRIRELKAPEDQAPDPDDTLFPDDIADVGQAADGMYNPDAGSLKEYSKRVVPARWDLDNTHVWEVLKSQVTDYNKLWEINPSLDYLKKLGKLALFPIPTVVYKVDEYTTCVGETVEAHDTKYQVEYKEDGDTTSITNTALLETSIYKRWLLFGDKDTPDNVWIVLNYRVKEKYRELFGEGSEKYMGLWLPVWKPLDGDIYTIFDALADCTDQAWVKYLDYLIKYDSMAQNLTFAISKLKKPEGSIHNPLTDWHAKFKIKKYGWFMIPGVPVEFQAEELTSTIITDVIKFETGLDIPISFIINPDGCYVTVPGWLFKIPLIDKDWELTGNILNIWADPSGDTAIGGTKIWAGDNEGDRPDSLTIVIKDKDDSGSEYEVGTVEIKKSDNAGYDTWPWALRQSDVTKAGVVLDPTKTYIVSEKFPNGYEHKDDYTLSVDGHNLTNTWIKDKTPKITIQKVLQHTGLSEERKFNFYIKDDQGVRINDEPYTITMSEEGTKSLTPDIPKEKIAGKDISKFTVEEVADPSGEYTVTYSGPTQSTDKQGNPVYTFTVTNTCKQLHYYVEVRWIGDTEEDRPTEVDIFLRNGDDGHVWVNRDSGWITPISPKDPLPTKEDAGDYQIEERPVPSNYTATYSWRADGDTITWIVTNTKDGPITVKGKKTWDDDGDQQHLRPDTIQINIEEKVHAVVQTLDVTAADGWQWEVRGLQETDEYGNQLEYYVTESTTGSEGQVIPGVEGYTTEYETPTYDENTKTWICNITNSTKKFQYNVNKIWDDQDDQYGVRPDKVTVHVLAKKKNSNDPPEELAQADLNRENDWSTVFILSPDENKEFYVREDDVDYYPDPTYTTTKSGDNLRTDITNKVSVIPVQKVWTGDTGYESYRPQSIQVQLVETSQSEIIQELTLRESEGWHGFFKGIPNEKSGLSYTVQEARIPGYETSNSGDIQQGFTITNTFNNKIHVTVKKEWVDLDQEAMHLNVEFTLTQKIGDTEKTETGVLNEGNTWKITYPDMPICDLEPGSATYGQLYTYSVVENPVPDGYSVSYQVVRDDTGFVLTIRNKQLKRAVRFKKIWDDEDQSEKRAEAQVWLVKNGEKTDQYQTIDQDTSPSQIFNFPNLDIYDERGNIIQYTVMEDPVPPEYTCHVFGNMSTEFEVRNTLRPQTTRVTVTKVWDQKSGAIPDHIMIRVKRLDTGETVASKELPVEGASEEDKWKWTFEGLQKYETSSYGLSVPIFYTVTEDPIPGYTTEIIEVQTPDQENFYFKVINHQDTLNRIYVAKIWDDENDKYGMRPDEIKQNLHLFKNGEECTNITITREGNTWNYTIRPKAGSYLPVYEDGEKVRYRLKEDSIEGYRNPYITGDALRGFQITNRLLTSYVDLTVTKSWVNPDEDHPDSVHVILGSDLQNEGSFVQVDSADLGSGNEWKHVFTHMPVWVADREISYRVTENPVPAGYEHPYIVHSGKTFKIYNWKADQITVDILKEWIGDKEKDRPESLTVRLKIGAGLSRTLTLTADDKWKAHVEDLPIPRRGNSQNALPLVVEEDTPEGYTGAVIGGVDESGLHYQYTIRNELIPAPTPEPTPTHEPTPYTYRFSFTKIWSNDSEDSIDWTLYNGDGQVIHKKFNKRTISDTEWVYEAWFASDVSEYYIIEDVPAGYLVYYENTGIHEDAEDRCYNGGKIINYKIPKTGDQTPSALPWILCLIAGLLGAGCVILICRKRSGGR